MPWDRHSRSQAADRVAPRIQEAQDHRSQARDEVLPQVFLRRFIESRTVRMTEALLESRSDVAIVFVFVFTW